MTLWPKYVISEPKGPKIIQFDDQNNHSSSKNVSKIYVLYLRDFLWNALTLSIFELEKHYFFFKQVRISPEINWFHYQSGNAAPTGIVRHRIKTEQFSRSVTSESTVGEGGPSPPPMSDNPAGGGLDYWYLFWYKFFNQNYNTWKVRPNPINLLNHKHANKTGVWRHCVPITKRVSSQPGI